MNRNQIKKNSTAISLHSLLLSFALPSLLTFAAQLHAQPSANAFLLYQETEATKHLTGDDHKTFAEAKKRFQADLDAFNVFKEQSKNNAEEIRLKGLEIQFGWRQYMSELLDMPMSSSAAHDRMRFEQAAELSEKNKALYNLYMQYLGALEGVGGVIEQERGEITTL